MAESQEATMPEPANPPIGFALAIRPRLGSDGAVASFDVQSQNTGVPDEVVITVIRNWLKAVEESYYTKFKGGQGKN